MNYDEVMNIDKVQFGDMPPQPFLLGLLSAFDNRYQAAADAYFKEITWKQFFAIICINLCKEPPTLNELSDVMGSSHQNVKQILLKLEKKGFVSTSPDEKDKRKQRIFVTDKCNEFLEKNDNNGQQSLYIIGRIFDGIDDKSLQTTIQTIMKMERNLSEL
ncbi:DNA-binding transcriptional regulator, MarR family [Pseudobutyrivibrio sp. ACV-2]|uniref:MarR family winged helix-turn-helix transcriptional regulator n=1 Tax=Pseudobutyrivibrio sp. ACV-2 TaxID=1520801 RepID=UPI00089BB017|nr:MarR family transcriptional regulator [Pseudobutyrivibrio sp. ACV-2]MBQ7147281.1 MarR family transcriptional regulator [Pseudobutyrivibrio sp.]SEA88350.1 DNA-binding transcriptional regulator, MarR family [Pseudobutyrivibrio sp. ACV-2]